MAGFLGLIGGAVGAAVGFYVGGPAGASYGWAIGSTVGSIVDTATTKIRVQGPKLNDLNIQVSTYGGMVPMHFGTVGVVGIPMWIDRITPHSKETSESGKGGPTTVTTTTTYTTSVAIMLGEGVCLGIRKITLDGKLWYSVAEDADVSTIVASSASSGQFKFYPGNETQLPDPTMEAVLGVGNVPGYRGEAYVVFTDNADILNGNSLRQLKFELVYAGSTAVQNKEWTKGPASAVDATTVPSPQAFVGGTDEMLYMQADTGPLGGNTTTPAAYKVWSVTPSAQVLLRQFDPGDQASNYYPLDGVSDEVGHLRAWRTAGTYTHQYYFRWIRPDASSVAFYAGTDFFADNPVNVSAYCKRGDRLIVLGGHAASATTYRQANLYSMAGTLIASRDFTGVMAATETIQAVLLTGSCAWVVSIDTSALANKFYQCSLADLSTITTVSYGYASSIPGGHPMVYGTIFGGISQVSLGSDDSIYVRIFDPTPDYAILRIDDAGVITTVAFDALIGPQGASQVDISGSAFGYNPSSGLLTFVALENTGEHLLWPYSVNLNAITAGTTTVGEVMSAICQRAGYTPAQLDMTQMTEPLLGYSIANVSPARSALEPLLKYAFADPVDSDGKTKFVKRGGPIVATIGYDDLCGHEYGQQMPEPFPLSRTQEVDLPRSLVVNFRNPLADYETGSERSPRRSTTSQNDVVDELPIVMLPQKAAEMASVLYFDQIIQRQPRGFSVLKGKFDYLEPTDPVYVEWPQGTFNPVRIVKRDENGPVLKFECVPEDADAYTPNAVAASSTVGQSSIAIVAPTALAPLDIPILRDADDNAGLYMAMASGASGKGAVLYRSVDDVDYRDVGSVEHSAIIGFATSVLGNWTGGNVFDEVNFVDVSLSDPTATLSGATQAAVLADPTLNAFALGLPGSMELGQFKVATLLSAGKYRISGLVRGGRGTEWTTGLHTATDQFAMLGMAGTLRPDEGASAIGALRYYRPVSIGRSLAGTYPTAFTNTGVGLKPLSPVNVRWGVNAAGDYLIHAQRRSRLQNRIGFLWDLPLGEASELYDLEIYSDVGYATLKRTFSNQTGFPITYTIAQQVIDFGIAPTGFYLKLYQRSAVVGRGYAARYALSNIPFRGAWNPDDTFNGAALTFSNALSTVLYDNALALGATTRAGQSASAGKRYFEIVIDSIGTANNGTCLGFCNAAAILNGLMKDTNASGTAKGLAIYTGQWWGPPGTFINQDATAMATGMVFGFYIDFDAGKSWFTRNGAIIGGGDPVAGTGAPYTFTANTPMFPFFNGSTASDNQQASIRLALSSFTYAPLTGFSAFI